VSDTAVVVLGFAILGVTAAALLAMRALWADRQAEIRAGRDDGTRPWLLTRVVILCAGATLIGLWLSLLAVLRMTGNQLPWSPPVSYAIGLLVTLLPSYVAWEFRRRGGR
jgi:hypothetical protein